MSHIYPATNALITAWTMAATKAGFGVVTHPHKLIEMAYPEGEVRLGIGDSPKQLQNNPFRIYKLPTGSPIGVRKDSTLNTPQTQTWVLKWITDLCAFITLAWPQSEAYVCIRAAMHGILNEDLFRYLLDQMGGQGILSYLAPFRCDGCSGVGCTFSAIYTRTPHSFPNSQLTIDPSQPCTKCNGVGFQ